MSHRDERREGVERCVFQYIFRPVGGQLHAAKRSGVAKAVRGSMISRSKPAAGAMAASAWLIWTAPITTMRGGGTWTLRRGSCLLLDQTGLAGEEGLRERVRGDARKRVAFQRQPVLTSGQIGHEDGGPAGALGVVQLFQDIEAHQATFST